MSVTLLLDLDDTLLENDIDVFLPAYLKLLSKELAPYADPQKMAAALMAGTQAMIDNRRPECTLREVFEEQFYPSLRLAPAVLEEPIRNFYERVFPALQELTRPRPEAVALVEEAFARGYTLAIATNPLFPRRAIEQRLAWAGLPVEKYPFHLVSSYESFHFAKPSPAFFAEVLARLGWPEGPVVIVGNSLEEDIRPAQSLGVPSFLISSTGGIQEQSGQSVSGAIKDVLTWIDNKPAEKLHPGFTSPQSLLAVLRSTPAVLNHLVGEVGYGRLHIRPEQDAWSFTEIVCHLRDVEIEVNLPRVRKVLQESNPFIPGKDTDPWAVERDYIHQNGLQALHRFNAARWALICDLEAASPKDWERTARHAIFGPTRLNELVGIQAGHDRLHIAQARKALDKA